MLTNATWNLQIEQAVQHYLKAMELTVEHGGALTTGKGRECLHIKNKEHQGDQENEELHTLCSL